MFGDQKSGHCAGRECSASGVSDHVRDAGGTPGTRDGCSCLVSWQGTRWSGSLVPGDCL